MRLIPPAACAALVCLLAVACGGGSEPIDPNVCGSKPCDGTVNGDGGVRDAGGEVPRDAGQDSGTPDAGSDAGGPDAGQGTEADGGSDAGTDAGPVNPIILFDPLASPRVLPSPNDLDIDRNTGLLNLTPAPDASEADRELTRDYLNTLNGFLRTSVLAARSSAPLDPATVTEQSVRVFQLYPWIPSVTPTVRYDAETRSVQVVPPPGGWPAGGRYLVALLGGAQGLRDLQGRPVVRGSTWRRVLSSTPLLDDAGHSTEPGVSDAEAGVLEPLRLAYSPLVGSVASEGHSREDVVALWTVAIMSQPEVTFEPVSPTDLAVPFPSNLFLASDGSRVNLPIPPGTGAFMANLLRGLNSRDGFSTTGVIVSENSPMRGALSEGRVDPGTLDAGTRFVRVDAPDASVAVDVCLGCASSPKPDGTQPSGPEQLQFVPRVALVEGTTYATVVTTDLRDVRGLFVRPSPTWALLRLSHPLVDGQGRSLVRGISDVLATSLEPLRQSFQPLLTQLETRGLPRSKVALANVFRTESTRTELRSLTQAATALPDVAVPLYLSDVSGQISSFPVPHDQLGGFFVGALRLASFRTATDGTLGPSQPRGEQADFVMTVPAAAAPAEGWPVVLFAHELGRSRNDLLTLANELARAGFVGVAVDGVLQGERSSCVGSAAFLGATSDDAACADPSQQRCETDPGSVSFGRCVARDPGARLDCGNPGRLPGDLYCNTLGTLRGRCVPTADNRRVCEGGSFLLPESGSSWGPLPPRISGWNVLDLARPSAQVANFRQQAIDLAQMVRALRSSEFTALSPVKLNTTELHLVAHGFGATAGALFTSVDDDVRRVVLNAPVADPLDVLLTSSSPSFNSRREVLFSFLAAQGYTQGTPQFDSVMNLYRWALESGSALPLARALKDRAGVPAGRDVLFQYIEGDDVLPETLTQRFIAAANIGAENLCPVSRWAPPTVASNDRHDLLLNGVGGGAVTRAVQQQAASFLSSGAVTPPPEDVRLTP